MRKNIPLVLALGIGYAIYRMFQQEQNEIRARQWARAERPQGDRGQGEHRPKALVTGASSGIGEVFARALARRGYDLVLLARRADRLQALAEELAREAGVRAEVLVADLAKPEDLERAAEQAAQMDLDLLVNNAGFGVGGRFVEVDSRRNMEMVQVNLAAAVRMARAVAPGMVARGNGGIINVSSVAAFFPSAGNHTYGATKAFLNFFSQALRSELEGSGVRVQALCPGYTYSEFHDVMQVSRSVIPSYLWLRAEDVVRESLLGLEEDRLIVVPGGLYKLAVALASIPGVGSMALQGERLMKRFSVFQKSGEVNPPEMDPSSDPPAGP